MEAAQPPESFRDGLIAAAELRLCEHSICMENLRLLYFYTMYMMIVMIRVFEIELVGT